ncbi:MULTISPECIES: hypothetical protein [unclassified Pseudomonas]|uniref:hypothetical protein n=1 Tax=unclassified Pseudomonas TaxID=196821 RepID=UPI0030DA0BFA
MKKSLKLPMSLLGACVAIPLSAPADTQHLENELVGKVSFLTSTVEKLNGANLQIDPFLTSPISPPPNYKGPLFTLSHDYPTQLPTGTSFPWSKTTGNGKITQANAGAYVQALKDYVSPDMRKIVYDYANWNYKDSGWYDSIWLGIEREPIRGVYVGSGFPAGTLTDQTLPVTTYVLTLYDTRAAKTLGDIWGKTPERAMNPVLETSTTQFAEGSVIIKFAMVSACGSDWAPMEGAAQWEIYAPVNTSNGSALNKTQCVGKDFKGTTTQPAMTKVSLMQFDIIVKDSVASPQTGWVFSTLVYDKNAPGKDAWDKMIPLGATWGGNPDVINTAPTALTPPVTVNPKLSENWINPQSPAYSVSTLGWDGRLSGPNDGAVVTPAWTGSHYYPAGLASAGCLGCHSSAQYPMTSFLLPTSSQPPQTIDPPLSGSDPDAALVMADPGSKLWMSWFQSRDGKTPMGPDTSAGAKPVALDYDMVTAFKAIPMWQQAKAAEAKNVQK